MAIDKSKFINAFKAETKEHLERLNEGILALEKNPQNAELLETLMKEAHTVKGSATMMGFNLIADIAHKMEDGFEGSPDTNKHMESDDYDLLFECLDAIESLLQGTLVRQAKSLEASYIDSLCARLLETFGVDQQNCEMAPDLTNEDTVPEEAPQIPPVQDESLDTHPDHDSVPNQETNTVSTGDSTDMPAHTATDPPRVTESTAEPTKAATTTQPESQPSTTVESIRVDVNKLDRLMNLSGEMLISKIRLKDLIKTLSEKTELSDHVNEELGDLMRQLCSVDESMNTTVSDIQDEVLNLRMMPVSHLFNTFPRAMRDLAKEHGKDVELVIKGQETHLDKNIIDRMKGPFVHLIRNSVDHGIEETETRLERHKPARGHILLNAYRAGNQVILEVSDDGGGINLEKVKQRALHKGLITEAVAQQMADEQITQLLFAPGFSTRDVVTETSGRGVGLDVVREQIAQLNGTITISTELGKGTRFAMKLPLTLSVTEALLIICGDDVFAIPIETVIETTRINLEEIEHVESNEVINLRGEIVPLIRIHQMFSLPKKGIVEKRFFPVVIVQLAEKKLGLLVDEIMGHQAIVIRPLGDPLTNIPNIAGGTVLGDGRVVLILDIPSIIRNTSQSNTLIPTLTDISTTSRDYSSKRILLAEDTPSTAMLEKSVLEAAGFFVTHAKDGEEALGMAAREQFDLVISDVLMPRMNGFELTSQLKGMKNYRAVPIIIVTTRCKDADRKRGLQAGADAYILKKDFTSDSFLETIDRLVL